MRLGETTQLQAAINITPLVDVVLVLLIIFMVMAPQMRKGPDVNLPNTAKPSQQGDERGRILISIDESTIRRSHASVSPKPFATLLLRRKTPRSSSEAMRSSTSARSGRPCSHSIRQASAGWG